MKVLPQWNVSPIYDKKNEYDKNNVIIPPDKTQRNKKNSFFNNQTFGYLSYDYLLKITILILIYSNLRTFWYKIRLDWWYK